MQLIDTHCHIYLDAFDEDRALMLARAKQQGVSQFYLPAIDSATHDAMVQLGDAYPEVCIPMMGLHPCSVKEDYQKELAIVEAWISRRDFVAIGEIGLDFYWDKTFVHEQHIAFEQQMQWALDKSLPIVIHTRNAMQETINAVQPFAKKGLKGIFHCFSGSYESAQQITKMGFHLGIGGVLTYKNAGLPEALEKIGLEWMVLETDAPYLTPVPFRGKRNEPAYLEHVVKKLAETKGVSVEELATITTANAQKIFSKTV
ncbi:MAG: TatD family hydrolase [Chitinophagaceae bacterium]|nr:TatD family hydrolase [Chitinophagaceae bacterium]